METWPDKNTNKPIGDERNMNKVLASLLMIGVVAAMAGAGTSAYFTDTETSTGNVFTAGTLDLVVDGENPATRSFFEIENVQPSYNGSVKVNLTNIGTCNGYLSMWIVNLTDDDNGLTEPESGVDSTGGSDPQGDLSQYLCIVIANGTDELYNGTLKNFATTYRSQDAQLDLGDLGAGQSREFTMGYYVPSDVGNIIQSDRSTFDIVVDLLQKEMPHP